MIRVSRWSEIRYMFLSDQIPKKQIARRLGVDVKTVRRAIDTEEASRKRKSPPRGRRLDRFRPQIEEWLHQDPKLTAKRIGKLLRPLAGRLPPRTVREYVALVRRELFLPEAFVHRTHRPGDTMEVDFGESWAMVGGRLRKVKFLVATLPASNVYFAKAYPVERLECLLDGIAAAFRHFGGTTRRVVIDNTSLAVKRVLKGTDREETDDFEAFRGAYPFHADFCAPGKGHEKGSVETGVKYVRNNVFRPMVKVASFAELNALILTELEEDLDARQLKDGRTARQAWQAEREHLRPLPAHAPLPCRTRARVVDKFGLVELDRAFYSVPTRHVYKAVWARLFSDKVEIGLDDQVIARHERSFVAAEKVIDPFHVLELLERKHRAVPEATALQGWELPEVFHELRRELPKHTRRPDREWIQVLRLVEEYAFEEVEVAVREALSAGTPGLESIQMLLRRRQEGDRPLPGPVAVPHAELAALDVAVPALDAYDTLWRDI